MIDLLDIPFGTRDVGHWERTPVSTRKEIYDFIDKYFGIDNIGISSSVFYDNKSYLLFLPFDFDIHDRLTLKDMLEQAMRLYNNLVRTGYSSLLTFSGRRGYHVYIKTVPKPYQKRQIRFVQKMFRDMLKLDIDEQLLGDVRRLMRIPWTPHPNGAMCEVIATNEGIDLDLDNICPENIMEEYDEYIVGNEEEYHEFPCVEDLIANDPEPRHIIRFAYIILRLAKGWTEDEIIEEIETFNWIDYNETYTRKQIHHIASREYIAPSCDTLKDMGYCSHACTFDKENTVNELKKMGYIRDKK